MARTVADLPDVVTSGDLGDELAAFLRAMRRANVSPNTLLTYGTAVRQFATFLEEHGYPTDVAAITTRHIDEWIGGLLDTWKPATASNRFRGLQRFLSWYAEKDDDWRNPMAKMRPPRLPQSQPRVLTLDELRAVLGTCRGKSFEDRRDTALLRILFNTGVRRGEIAGLHWSTDPALRDVDLQHKRLHVYGKGRKDRLVAIDDNTVDALDDYIRARKRHPDAASEWLWLGKRGRLTDSGIAQAVRTRGQQAGIAGLHPHELRHAWRHHAERAGLSRESLMALGGWESDAMLRRYASTTANELALEQAARVALGDQL